MGNAETPSGNSFRVYDSAGNLKQTIRVDTTPGYVAFDKAADIWASAPLGTSVNHYNAKGRDLGGPLTKNVKYPYGVAINAQGYIYISDLLGGVAKFNPNGQLVATLL